MVAYCFSVAHRGSGSLPKRVMYYVLERTKLEVGPATFSSASLWSIVLNALLAGATPAFRGKGLGDMYGYATYYYARSDC